MHSMGSKQFSFLSGELDVEHECLRRFRQREIIINKKWKGDFGVTRKEWDPSCSHAGLMERFSACVHQDTLNWIQRSHVAHTIFNTEKWELIISVFIFKSAGILQCGKNVGMVNVALPSVISKLCCLIPRIDFLECCFYFFSMLR